MLGDLCKSRTIRLTPKPFLGRASQWSEITLGNGMQIYPLKPTVGRSLRRLSYGSLWRTANSLLSFLVVFSWTFAASAFEKTKLIPPTILVSNPIIGIEPVISQDQSKQSAPQPNQSSDLMSDIDDNDDAGLEDLRAGDASRTDHDTQAFFTRDIDAEYSRAPSSLGAVVVPTNSFCCLHQHLRERGPPRSGVNI